MNKLFNVSAILKFQVMVIAISSLILIIGYESKAQNKEGLKKEIEPHVMAANQIDAGRYLSIIAGCNDCHTEGYLQAEGNIPEEDWFAGSSLGWQGPWGTTYPSNLRLIVQDNTEEDWVSILHEREDLPPMPWMNVNQMSEKDAKAIYHYIKSLGPKGDYVPDALDPGVEPETPYLSMMPLNLPE
ncbi:MAG: c-type cytochrome [Ignavibacteriaceae bacterium]